LSPTAETSPPLSLGYFRLRQHPHKVTETKQLHGWVWPEKNTAVNWLRSAMKTVRICWLVGNWMF